ncbi:MAG: phenylacetate-CoA oxygenase subunit PaaI [Acidobacteria bacterium]|nr:phenylacetate-CoA oxygenase subunit PaaI [Acidobacteriota bacterium]
MTSPKTIESKDEMTPEYRALVKQLLESQGYREVMAANLFGHAMKHIPTLAYKKLVAHQLEEELEHFEEAAKLYHDVTGKDLLNAVQSKMERVPYPESWTELAMAQFLYDRAGEFHLREYRTCSFAPYARIVTKILEEEEGHEGFGEQVVLELAKEPKNRAILQTLFEKWLTVALLSFGRPATEGNRFAIAAGLKSRDSGAVMNDFINDIKATMTACGLQFPERDKIGIAMPDDIDLSLPA